MDASPPLALDFAGAGLPIRLDGAGTVARHLEAIAPTWPAAPLPHAPAAAIAVGRDPAGYSVAAPWLMEPFTGLTDVAAACALFVELGYGLIAAAPDWLCLHAAAIETEGRLVVLIGDFRAGKSTLSVQLAAAGGRLFADDILPLADDGRAVALGIAPRLRLPLPGTAAPALRAFVARHRGPCDDRYGYVRVPGQAPHGRRARIDAFVLLDRRRDGPAGLAPLPPGEALKQIVRRNHARAAPSAVVLDRLAGIVGAAACARLFYADLEEAAAVLGGWARAGCGPLAAPDAAPGHPLAETAEDAPAPAPADPAVPYVARGGFAVRAVGEELFLASAAGHAIIHLNPLAAAAWRLLRQPRRLGEVAAVIAAAFPEEPQARIEADVAALFAAFLAADLVRAAGDDG